VDWTGLHRTHDTIPTVKPSQFYVCVLIVGSVSALCCQSPHADESSKTHPFHWDSSHSEELDAKDALGQLPGISTSERDSLIEVIAAQLKIGDDYDHRSDEEWRKIASQTSVKLIDLNSDGIPEVIAQGANMEAGCSPTGNCPLWVFQRSGQTYKILLTANAIQTFTIQTDRTNQFLDLVLGMHGSAFEQELFVYQFQKGKYRRSGCYDAQWEHVVNGEWEQTKDPIISRCRR
jgi:hypothetical protein